MELTARIELATAEQLFAFACFYHKWQKASP